MILTIPLADGIYEKYVAHNPTNPRLAITQTLERFQDTPTKERPVIFQGQARKVVETIFGKPIEDVEKYCEWLQEVISVKIGGVNVPLRAGQIKLLQNEATHRKLSFEEYAPERIQEALSQVLGNY